MRAVITLAAVLAALSGQIDDRTTGQPLANVHVHAGNRVAVTGGDGRYVLRGLKPGAYTLTIESDDVPPEHLAVTLHPGANRRDIDACSTTLDYGCSR